MDQKPHTSAAFERLNEQLAPGPRGEKTDKVPSEKPRVTGGAVKALGYFLLGALWFAALVVVTGSVVYGMVWVSAKLYPIAETLSVFGFVVLVLNLLPSTVFKGSRGYCGNGIVIVSYIWGVALWMYAILVLYGTWGAVGIYIGFLTLGVATVPLACLASLFKGEWALAGELILAVSIVFCTRALGFWIISKVADDPIQQPAPPPSRWRANIKELKAANRKRKGSNLSWFSKKEITSSEIIARLLKPSLEENPPDSRRETWADGEVSFDRYLREEHCLRSFASFCAILQSKLSESEKKYLLTEFENQVIGLMESGKVDKRFYHDIHEYYDGFHEPLNYDDTPAPPPQDINPLLNVGLIFARHCGASKHFAYVTSNGLLFGKLLIHEVKLLNSIGKSHKLLEG